MDHWRPSESVPGDVRDTLRQCSQAVFWGMLAMFALQMGLTALIQKLLLSLGKNLFGIPARLVSILISLSMMLLPALFIRSRTGLSWAQAFPLGRVAGRKLAPAVFCCLGASAVGVQLSALLALLLQFLTGKVSVMPPLIPPIGPVESALYFLQAAILPAFLEELLFRGAIMQSLRPFGDRFALVVSSLLFALAHGNLVQAPNAMLSGLVLGYFALYAGSLFPSILMHFVNNGLVAVSLLFTISIPATPLYLLLGIIGIWLMQRWHGGFCLPEQEGQPLESSMSDWCFFTTPPALIFWLWTGFLILSSFQ